ncbi:serine/threonine protein kinase [Pseudanabaena sp. SR411]|uniref:AAA family ATPase n=1 Tax=Pseudanabaena sp. SR411 TaxID=1980935 RepID=UPI000B97CBB7|nr:AAA family ATPase [Pseudanabaena sp. SR411]OYQ62050.1 serine/threonine protein kinase [Pseudanabaena sp. SR411]
MIVLSEIAIQDKIYESSNSLVYRGIRGDGRAIIVKMLKQDYPSPQELIRYRQEYEVTSSLNLEGVVKAYNQQNYQRTLVILLEDFGGESLEQWILSHPETFCPMPLSTFLRLAIELIDILGKIHAAHVIHKDINPGNIVLNLDTGIVKIIDFGIATQFSRTNPTFKSPHVLEGTIAYLSPEQTGRMNRSLDYRTDFYSLGVTFYELVTGHLPFPTADMLELVHCHIAKQPVPPCEMNAVIAKPISDLILKLMAKNAEDRYQSAWGIKADLELCAHQLEASDRIDSFQIGLHDVSNQFQIPQKLYGREAETATLLAAFERVVGGDTVAWGRGGGENDNISASSEMMLVSGYAGIGKSALVQELYKPITVKQGYFISGKFDQFQRNIPYSAIADALQKLVRQLLSEPDEQVQQWRSLLQTALGSNGQLIIDVIPEVEFIIGKQSPVPEVGATEAQNRFNRAFQQFIRVLCSKDRPLAIFLDDLQWVDSATLKLIELLMLDEQIQSLFLIGAYRDNEVNPTQPLVLTLERLRKQGVVLQEIVLAPLTLEPLSQLLAETLYQNSATVCLLAELVLRKTEGNPFFINEFLRFLYSENLLSFDAERLSWQWNIAQIQAQDITDNVVELMLIKLKKLPEVTQQMLCLAACIGAEFNLETLAIVCEQPLKGISLNLLVAAQAGLIQPLSEVDENLLVQEYKFLHDHVQQAAYALIDESQKQVVHLQIGRNLIEKTLSERLSERLFEIVDQLNHGVELVTNQVERDEIAKLNLLAGQKARGAIAYTIANKYLAVGRAWLTVSSWQTNYNLTLNLHLETTEIAYLCGEFEQVESWAAIVLQEAKTVLDRVKIYDIKIQTSIAQNQLLEAINIALNILQQLGISFPRYPSQSDIQFEIDEIASLLSKRSIEGLIHLPEMIQPDKLEVMRILSRITTVTQIAAPNLMLLFASKQVSLSIQYGNTFASPVAYANFGLILCGMLGNIDFGYKFSQLALRLLSQPNTRTFKARTVTIVSNFIIIWKDHVREVLQPFLEGYQSGLETGDLEFAGYCAHCYCFHAYVVGKELVELERKMTTQGEAIRQIKQEIPLVWNQIYQQTVLNLMGRSDNPIRLIGEAYNEEIELSQHKAANDGFAIFNSHLSKLFLCYLFYEYEQAVQNSAVAENYLLQMTATFSKALYYFYESLSRLATYPENNAQVQSAILTKVTAHQKKMKHWADYAPMNYLHKYHLVEAEKARVLGQLFDAEEFYEQAIQGARDNEYLQEEALAYELAAKFYLERGRSKFAQTYMKEAHYCYERWGATAKVKDLETRYPQFFPQSSDTTDTAIHTTSGTTSNTSPIAFDLATVLKASQAISSEIELDRLLRTLMRILIENAGAQTGCLILENVGTWTIEASCELNDGEQVCAEQVLQSLPTTNHLPESIIQYVIRTHETVLLNDATREGHFINEPYIQHNHTQSIFCLPLLNQSKLVGMLYLENQLATGAFTPERSQVLHLLSTQAAIAIENAKLYSKLRAGESRMAQFLEAVPVGIGVLDATGRPYYFNQRGIQLLGKGVDASVAPDHLAEIYQVYLAGTDQNCSPEAMPIIRALKGECVRTDDLEIHQGETIIPIEAWGTPVFDEHGNVAYAIAAFQDITVRKEAEKLLAEYNQTLEMQVTERTLRLSQEIEQRQQAENALRLSEEQRRLTMDFSYIGSWNWNIVENTVDWDDNHIRLLGLVPGEVKGSYQAWRDRVHPEDIGRVEQTIAEALATRTHYEAEYRVIYPNGSIHWLVARGRGIYNTNGHPVQMLGVILDISEQRDATLRERKRAEEASILEERNRMAREIHDTLAQVFTGILLHIGAATEQITKNPERAQAHMQTIDELARAGLAEARRSVTTLRPKLLEEGDLYRALNRLTAQMKSSTNTHITCEIIGVIYALSPDVENNLLRIGQESLTNAIKYAHATAIHVELVYEETQCILRINDDGQGFEVDQVYPTKGFGLLGMSERVEQIGGELIIRSQLDRGTEIIVIVNRE